VLSHHLYTLVNKEETINTWVQTDVTGQSIQAVFSRTNDGQFYISKAFGSINLLLHLS
jgi:hypothetical protein